jgi:hypothetical protein
MSPQMLDTTFAGVARKKPAENPDLELNML